MHILKYIDLTLQALFTKTVVFNLCYHLINPLTAKLLNLNFII